VVRQTLPAGFAASEDSMFDKIAGAAAAYGRASGLGNVAGPEATAGGPSFLDLVKDSGSNARDISQKGEQVTADALLGKANVIDVVTAVSNADVSLQTVVAVRDKVLQAYQEIMRMPI
jgi:flagellar hook-basal body complex protein FliE